MHTPEELTDRIRFRIRAFLEAMETGAQFTLEEIVTVLWPKINEASARDASEKVQAELDHIGLGSRSVHAVPADYGGREALSDTLTKAVLAFAEQHQWLDIAIERPELIEKLEAMRRFGLVWSWSDGDTESDYDGYSDPLGDGYDPNLYTVQLTMAGVLGLVSLVESDPNAAGIFRQLVRDVMTEEQLGS